MNSLFNILTQTSEDSELISAANKQLEHYSNIEINYQGNTGKEFINKWIEAYKKTGSPIFVNLDSNISNKSLTSVNSIMEEMEKIVESTAGHVTGYKLNFQSMLTFLISKRIDFVTEIRDIYKSSCKRQFNEIIEPVVWLDQKLADIPNTNYQSADILFKLGFDAVHGHPLLGPDSMAGIQRAAEENGNKGVVYVVNMTHDGFNQVVKRKYLLPGAIDVLRNQTIKDRVVGTIEPANRPFEIFDSYSRIYRDNLMIISIGIGIQGALPGSALYAGASCEGIGRFIINGMDDPKQDISVEKRAKLCKECSLLAILARENKNEYPLGPINSKLKQYRPEISEQTKIELDLIHKNLKKHGKN
ncbi:MAG: orotidine 5'-phosphate decarboxylase [Bacteroidales bacterium]|nr:orotidine 5'-phosphate decarboxylase [Bacteroidales bacterium]